MEKRPKPEITTTAPVNDVGTFKDKPIARPKPKYQRICWDCKYNDVCSFRHMIVSSSLIFKFLSQVGPGNSYADSIARICEKYKERRKEK
jgi:hypothetical protein